MTFSLDRWSVPIGVSILRRTFEALHWVGQRLWKVDDRQLRAASHIARAMSEIDQAIKTLE